jgi:8-oxo-dGTP pyrophosphatase MutT (NUDIX family)
MAGPRIVQGLNFISHVCCGGVVLDRLASDANVLLIEVDKGRHPQWLLPKGHVNPGEPHEDAARREVSEETGIPVPSLKALAYLGKIEYTFPPVPRHELHRKTVHFYLMLAENPALETSPVMLEEGIASAHWFSRGAAKEIVRYEGNREMIERAEMILEQLMAHQIENAARPKAG